MVEDFTADIIPIKTAAKLYIYIYIERERERERERNILKFVWT